MTCFRNLKTAYRSMWNMAVDRVMVSSFFPRCVSIQRAMPFKVTLRSIETLLGVVVD